MKNQNLLIIGVIVAIVLSAIALYMNAQSNAGDIQANLPQDCGQEHYKRIQSCRLEASDMKSCVDKANAELQFCLGNGGSGGCDAGETCVICTDPITCTACFLGNQCAGGNGCCIAQ